MKFLVEPTEPSWLAVAAHMDGREIPKLFSRTQGAIIDLDGTIAHAAKEIVYGMVASKHALDRRFLGWCGKNIFKVKVLGPRYEVPAWREFQKTCLQRPEERQEVAKRYQNPDNIEASLIYGAREVLGYIAGKKTLFSRNFPEVLGLFSASLECDGYVAVPHSDPDKVAATERYLAENPNLEVLLVMGDSHEEAQALGVAKVHASKKSTKLETAWGIYVAKNSRSLDHRFCANVNNFGAIIRLQNGELLGQDSHSSINTAPLYRQSSGLTGLGDHSY